VRIQPESVPARRQLPGLIGGRRAGGSRRACDLVARARARAREGYSSELEESLELEELDSLLLELELELE
jgi:hypothetical protein